MTRFTWTALFASGLRARWKTEEAISSASPRGQLVLWPGTSDPCSILARSILVPRSDSLAGLGNPCAATGLVTLMSTIESRYDMDVHCIQEGYAGLVGDIEQQIDDVCQRVPRALVTGSTRVNYLGFSQGGLFLRSLLQRCDALPEGPLVTLGSPHAGVTSWPSCPVDASSWFCSIMDTLFIDDLGTTSLARRTIVPASYLYDPDADAGSPFLSAVNSCRETGDKGLYRLKYKATTFVAFSFEHDAMLEPPASAWFGRWNGDEVVPFEQQAELDCLRDVPFERRVVPGASHMQLDEAFFFSEIVDRYFSSNEPMGARLFAKT